MSSKTIRSVCRRRQAGVESAHSIQGEAAGGRLGTRGWGRSGQAVVMDDGIAASARLIGEIRGNAFAMSAARRRRPVVLVVGAEDSGALLCSRVLPVLGIRMTGRGTDEGGTGRSPLHGAAGGPGRSQVAALHDRILALFGSGDADAVDDLQMPVSWWADPRVAAIRREIADLVNRGIGTGRVGFYDPCTMRLMPVWNQIAKELKLAPKIIHCLRNPATGARTARARRDGAWARRVSLVCPHARILSARAQGRYLYDRVRRMVRR